MFWDDVNLVCFVMREVSGVCVVVVCLFHHTDVVTMKNVEER